VTDADDAPVIAIDGPAASGKGTIAFRVAEALGFHYLDSGALYRLVALAAGDRGIDLDDVAGVVAVASDARIRFVENGAFLDGVDVSEAIRTEDVSARASAIAVYPALRATLLARQRAFRSAPGLVAEGRDMGSVVFADAKLKVFVTASSDERARRRHKQLMDKGIQVTLDSLLREILERDARDRDRPVAPLKPMPDAVVLDTTALSVEAAVAFVLERYHVACATPS